MTGFSSSGVPFQRRDVDILEQIQTVRTVKIWECLS